MPKIYLPRALDPDSYYDQTNNTVEAIRRKAFDAVKAKLLKAGFTEDQAKGYLESPLESCGPTSVVMLLDAAGYNVRTATPGGWAPQPEDLLTTWFIDSRNFKTLLSFRKDVDPNDVMGNEVPQWYPPAVKAVFGVRAVFHEAMPAFTDLLSSLQNKRGVMLCLAKPGHYIAVTGVDTDTRDVTYGDPWPRNPWPVAMKDHPGHARVIPWAFLAPNLKPFWVEIGN